MLVNNAGIQRQVDFTSPKIAKRTLRADDELAINLEATIRLCALFAPKFMMKKRAAMQCQPDPSNAWFKAASRRHDLSEITIRNAVTSSHA